MKNKLISVLVTMFAVGFPTSAFCVAGIPVTSFTYQGQLHVSGSPANGSNDLRFALFDFSIGGLQISTNILADDLRITNGLFSVALDWGGAPFDGFERWLEISVRPANSDGLFTPLSPRQRLTPTPTALFAFSAGTATSATNVLGTLGSGQLGGTYGNLLRLTNAGNVFSGSGAGLTNVNAATLNGLTSSNFWRLDGNAGTTPNTHFLGTTDLQPLELRVEGRRGLRLEPAGSNSVNVIGGWAGNYVANGVVGATVAGGGAGNDFGFATTNRALAKYSTVSGGSDNAASDRSATVGGGDQNVAGGFAATVGGGQVNRATNSFATVGGGFRNIAAGDSSIVAGGSRNVANGLEATVGGGNGNTATGPSSTVAGGTRNLATTEAAAIGGGQDNTAEGNYATVGGGATNKASADWGTVAGGQDNRVNGNFGTIPGGRSNFAVQDAFAAGRRAFAQHTGSFVWGDSTEENVGSSANNQFTVRASGGARFFSNTALTTGVTLAIGGGSWTTLSDRNAKENFTAVDPRGVLEKVVALPLSTWNYKSQDAAVRHLGPMAQDFKAAFGLGESETGITSVDADGVTLAAIQGLNQKLETENAALKARLDKLEKMLAKLTEE